MITDYLENQPYRVCCKFTTNAHTAQQTIQKKGKKAETQDPPRMAQKQKVKWCSVLAA